MKRYTPYLDVPYESDLKGEWVRQEDVEALLALNAEIWRPWKPSLQRIRTTCR